MKEVRNDKASGGLGSQRKGACSSGGGGKSKVFKAKKEKRRPRLILSDTDSDDDLVYPPRNGKEAMGPKKDCVMYVKKISEDVENGGKRITEKPMEIEKSRMDYFKCNEDGAEIDRKKMNTESFKRKEVKTDDSEPCMCRDGGGDVDKKIIKGLVNERKRCKEDSYKFRQDTVINRKKIKIESWKCKEDATNSLDPCYHQKDAEVGKRRVVGAGNERKRNRVGSFDLREDAEVVRKNIKMENGKSREGKPELKDSRPLDPKLMGPTARWKEGETECGRGTMVDKKMVSNLHINNGSVVDRNRETEDFDKKRLRLNKDENFCQVGVSKEKLRVPCDKTIRVQGKGGVLKLSSNNTIKVGGLEEKYDVVDEKEKGKESEAAKISGQKVLMDPSLYGRNKTHEKPSSSIILSKNYSQPHKVSAAEKNKAHGSKIENNGLTLHAGTKNIDISSIEEEEKSKKECSELEIPLPTKRRTIQKKAGRRTEKQLLCDQIKNMLLSAGWTIDYRPRKSRDYKDAVYIAPSGTEHWSILRAYYAFQKQLNCESISSGNSIEQELSGSYSGSNHKLNEINSLFSMIPEEVLSILKRKTVNKKLKGAVDKVQNLKKVSKTKFVKNKNLKGRLNSSVAQERKNTKYSCFKDTVKGELKLVRAQKPFSTSDSPMLLGRKNKKCRGSALLARSSSKEVNVDADDFVPYPGKRTLLSWLIDLGTVCENAKVQYMNRKRKRAILKGWITREGIHCSCCSKILTASKFEIHAGSKLCQPFENIFVETGDSLLQCMLDAWDKQEEAERSGFHSIDTNGDDPNDDTCGICGDGGDLICCDGCPSTFHQCCLNIQMLPPGDWHCSNCSCRFCGVVGGSTCQDDSITISSLLSCSQCEKKYHQACICEMDAVPVSSNAPGTTFCGQNCRKLSNRLQKLLGVKNYLDAGFSWMLVRRFGKNSETSSLGLAQRAECNSKVAVAAAVMNECFLPITDQRSGINMIQNVLYNRGSNFNRLNYSGFYSVVLERGDEIVSAASIRLHGTRLAEMPFIGTRHMYRRQGMCRRLLNAIEMALSSLDVEKLVIPAISELMHAWTQVFGFKLLEESHRQEMKSMNLMVFPATDMLQKPLLKGDGNTSGADGKAIDINSSYSDTTVMANTSLEAFSVGTDVLAYENGIIHDVCKVERGAAAEHGLHTSGASSGEGTECYNESWNKSTNSAPDVPLFVHDTDAAPQYKPEMEDQSLNLKPFGDSTMGSVHDNHDLSNVVGVEPNLHAFGVNPVLCTSEATSASPDAFSVSSFQASLGSTVLQYNSELLVKPQESTSDASSFLASDGTERDTPPFEVHDTDGVKVDIAAAEPIVYAFCEESVQCTSEFIPQSLDVASEYKLQASRCNPDDSGEGGIVSDKQGIKIGVASVEPSQHAFGDASVVLKDEVMATIRKFLAFGEGFIP